MAKQLLIQKPFSSIGSTSATFSFTPRAYIEIVSRKIMSILTMCFSFIYSSNTSSSKNILSKCDSLKMIRVYTISVITNMVNYKIIRNVSFMNHIRNSMCKIMLFIKSHIPIFCNFMYFSCPFPTAVRKFYKFIIKTFSHTMKNFRSPHCNLLSGYVDYLPLYHRDNNKSRKIKEVCFG